MNQLIPFWGGCTERWIQCTGRDSRNMRWFIIFTLTQPSGSLQFFCGFKNIPWAPRWCLCRGDLCLPSGYGAYGDRQDGITWHAYSTWHSAWHTGSHQQMELISSLCIKKPRCGSVGWTSSHAPKVCEFDPWLGCVQEANQLMFLSLSF